MRIEEGLDAGAVLLQEAVEIGAEETAGELSGRLARVGAELVLRTLAGMEAGTLVATPQREEEATYAPRLTRASGRVDWSLPASALYDRLRAYTPWPGLWATLRGEPVKLVAARPVEAQASAQGPEALGTFLGLADGRLAIACGGGTVLGVESLQRPGRRALPAVAFANGERLRPGERFG
jgi:methionyl-tRNA formyltransferase